MLKRTLTGIVITLILVGALALRLVSTYIFDAFIFAIIIGSIYEMSVAFKAMNKNFNVVFPGLVAVGIWAAIRFSQKPLVWVLAVYLFVFILCMVYDLIYCRASNNSDEQPKLLEITKNTLFVSVYPVGLISSFFAINALGVNLGFVGLIMAFAVSIFTDVFAYCFGMMLSKKLPAKLAPTISPKKSIVGAVFGLIGGVIAAIVGWVMFYNLNWFGALSSVSSARAILIFSLIGVVGSIVTQLGDLVASAIKRKAGIKDYSNLMPGHGGLLDRLDGQMFSALITFIVLILLI